MSRRRQAPHVQVLHLPDLGAALPHSKTAQAGSIAFACSEVCSFSTVSDGVGRLIVNHRAVGPSLAWGGTGLLPSAGITRPRRYYCPGIRVRYTPACNGAANRRGSYRVSGW
ncbi:protein of unknown function [Rhodovastum atsumiense]|nr:protein of unknown function [Rhodovastum atsumiense]